jgi:hypothetical protein
MAKGEATRQAILARAFELAKTDGLSGLPIGRLADETALSKSFTSATASPARARRRRRAGLAAGPVSWSREIDRLLADTGATPARLDRPSPR